MVNLKINFWKSNYVQLISWLQMKKLKVNIFIEYKLFPKLNTISIGFLCTLLPKMENNNLLKAC
jgi:hypothetical protein